MSNLAASLADWLRKCCGRTRLETAADARLAAAHTRGTGDQLLAGGHNPSLVDDSETPAVALGGTITFLQELESRVTARAFRPRWRPHQGHLFFQLILPADLLPLRAGQFAPIVEAAAQEPPCPGHGGCKPVVIRVLVTA